MRFSVAKNQWPIAIALYGVSLPILYGIGSGPHHEAAFLIYAVQTPVLFFISYYIRRRVAEARPSYLRAYFILFGVGVFTLPSFIAGLLAWKVGVVGFVAVPLAIVLAVPFGGYVGYLLGKTRSFKPWR